MHGADPFVGQFSIVYLAPRPDWNSDAGLSIVRQVEALLPSFLNSTRTPTGAFGRVDRGINEGDPGLAVAAQEVKSVSR